MKIKITSGTVIRDIGSVETGSVHEVDRKTAIDLFVAGKAVPYADKPRKPTTRKTRKPRKKKAE